jgi:hypothetical protein
MARVVLVLGHLPVICERCCAFLGGVPKATLVNLDCQLAAEPRSGGRHNGDIVCRQARESREKNCVSHL